MNGGTVKELSLSGHTHPVSDIIGTLTANPWTYIMSKSVTVTTTGMNTYDSELIYQVSPQTYHILFIKMNTFTLSSIGMYGGAGIYKTIDNNTPNDSSSAKLCDPRDTNSQIAYIKTDLIPSFTYTGRSLGIWSHIYAGQSTGTVSWGATFTIYGMKNP